LGFGCALLWINSKKELPRNTNLPKTGLK